MCGRSEDVLLSVLLEAFRATTGDARLRQVSHVATSSLLYGVNAIKPFLFEE